MAYRQLVAPNPNVPCQPGWCLKYVADAYGGGYPVVYPSATAAWNGAQFKHQDQSFPAGVAVPVWFSIRNVPEGHVAIRMPDGSVYSTTSGTSNRAVHHPNMQDLLNAYAPYNPLTYLGWTEDLAGKRLVINDGGDDMADKINLDTARILTHGVLARNGLAGRIQALDGSTDADLNANHVGKELTNSYVQGLFLSGEGRQWRDTSDANSIPGINQRLAQADVDKNTVVSQRQTIDAQAKRIAELEKELEEKPVPPTPVPPTPPSPEPYPNWFIEFWNKVLESIKAILGEKK